MKDPTNSEIIAILYDAKTNMPFTVFTREKGRRGCCTWDFDYCPLDRALAFHNSGCGGQPYVNRNSRFKGKPPTDKIWIKPGIRVFEDCGPRRRRPRKKWDWKDPRPLKARKLRRWGYQVLKSPIQYGDRCNLPDWNPFEHADAIEGQTVWCNVCLARRVEDYSGACEHLTWCDDCQEFTGPGAEKQTCEHDELP